MKPRFKIVNKKNLYKGFFEMNELRFIHQKYDGTWSNEIKREVFRGSQVATLLPYDPIKKEVILIQQFQRSLSNCAYEPAKMLIPSSSSNPLCMKKGFRKFYSILL